MFDKADVGRALEFSEEELLDGIRPGAQPPSDDCATLLIAGDICMAYVDASAPDDGLEAPWSGLGDSMAGHGLRVANLECPLTLSNDAIAKSGPSLRADPDTASIVRRGGFDVVGLANNHIRDYGSRGVLDTLEACASAGLLTVGAGKDLPQARLPLAVTVQGVRIGILSVSENEFGGAAPTRPGGNPFDPPTVLRDVLELRERVDVVLVLFHGGAEGYRLPSPGMVQRCRFLVDAGAAAVVCTHTHVPSGIEVYRGAPIAYGLGNFFFDPPVRKGLPDAWYVGYCFSLSLAPRAARRFAIIPYRQLAGRHLVTPMRDSDALMLARETAALSAVIKDEVELAQRWIGFCQSRRSSLLGGVLGLSRVEKALVKRGAWPFWRIPRRRLPTLLNLLRCESHHDALVALLELEMRDGDGG